MLLLILPAAHITDSDTFKSFGRTVREEIAYHGPGLLVIDLRSMDPKLEFLNETLIAALAAGGNGMRGTGGAARLVATGRFAHNLWRALHPHPSVSELFGRAPYPSVEAAIAGGDDK